MITFCSFAFPPPLAQAAAASGHPHTVSSCPEKQVPGKIRPCVAEQARGKINGISPGTNQGRSGLPALRLCPTELLTAWPCAVLSGAGGHSPGVI